MRTIILGLLAETAIHPGAGRGMGVVDLPVARECSTDYPVLVGSSLKGALRDKAEATKANEVNNCFGTHEQAGSLLVSDGQLLLLPVRSLTSSYRWITCPHIIERYRRNLARAGFSIYPKVPEVNRGEVLAKGADSLFLEERQFVVNGEPELDLVNTIRFLILHKETQDRLIDQIAILHDDDFAWFVRYGLSIQARNVLDKNGTKKSKNLWYEETLPPDTIMHALIMSRDDESIAMLDTLFTKENPYLQTGGNETVGQGWFAVSMHKLD